MKSKKTAKMSEKAFDYDFNSDNEFSAIVKLGPNSGNMQVDSVKIDKLDHVGNLTFDDVLSVVDAEIENKYPSKSYPDLEVVEYLTYCNEIKKWVPVVSESDKNKINTLKKSNVYDRYLELPDATYSLTPEAEMWMTLKNQGLLDEDSPFDFDKMHEILEMAKKIEKSK